MEAGEASTVWRDGNIHLEWTTTGKTASSGPSFHLSPPSTSTGLRVHQLTFLKNILRRTSVHLASPFLSSFCIGCIHTRIPFPRSVMAPYCHQFSLLAAPRMLCPSYLRKPFLGDIALTSNGVARFELCFLNI